MGSRDHPEAPSDREAVADAIRQAYDSWLNRSDLASLYDIQADAVLAVLAARGRLK